MINVDNVTFNYKNHKLFDNLNIRFIPGKIYGLLGKNGAGKTTLLKLISGLLFPGSGSCFLFDQKAQLRNPELLQDVYFLPETYDLPKMDVRTYVDFYAPLYPNFDRELLNLRLKELEIDRSKLLSTFSYGQKKKFLLAFAIATSARLLLFDEPTNGVDIPSQRQVRRMIIEASREDRTIIISTHHMRELETTFDNLAIVDEGKLLLNHSIPDITAAFKSTVAFDLNSTADVIYYEKTAGGYSVLQKNPDNSESAVDLDFFFSAVLETPYEIGKILDLVGDNNQTMEEKSENN